MPAVVTGAVASEISYQGRLTNPTTGAPLNGTYDLEFTFWTLAGGGVQIGATIARNAQPIANGLYSTKLAVSPADINGQELWLQIRVRATGGTWETLVPRVQVLPTAYALSLRPGAQIQGAPDASDGEVVGVTMGGTNPLASAVRGSTATGSALAGNSTGGYGVYGYSENGYAVAGFDAGSTQARGYGGYFSSSNGVGVFGDSTAQSHWTNMYAPGVYGKSAYGAGVYGLGTGTSWPSYGGVFEGRSGISARATGTVAQDGYAGTFASSNFRGIYAVSVTGYYDAYFPGTGGIYSAGGVFALAANATVALNGADVVLEPGDVVAISSMAPSPMAGGPPILAVRKADGADDIAIVGVVAQALRVETVLAPDDPAGQKVLDVQPVEGSAAPGGYVAIISQGLAPAVKVTAPAEPLRVGELVGASAVAGTVEVQRAGEGAATVAGATLGKIVGPYDPQTGTVPVFITLQ